MSKIRDFRDLTVWQRSVDLAAEIYRMTRRFPAEEQRGLTAQLRRAVISVSSNIAEGSARTTLKDRRNFYGVSRSSLKEVESLLYVSQRLSIVQQGDCEAAFGFADQIGRMLTRMRQNLRGK